MSTYFNCEAKITYKSADHFSAAVSLLKVAWLDRWDRFHAGEDCPDGADEPLQGGEVNAETLSIHIPSAYYRNLARYFEADQLFAGALPGSKAVWASTDGMFTGGICLIEGDGQFSEKTIDLEVFGKEDGEEVPDPDTEAEDFCKWRNDVVSDFVEEHSL